MFGSTSLFFLSPSLQNDLSIVLAMMNARTQCGHTSQLPAEQTAFTPSSAAGSQVALKSAAVSMTCGMNAVSAFEGATLVRE